MTDAAPPNDGLGDWNPIATAPRDGTSVEAWNAMTGPYRTAWSDAEWPMRQWKGQAGTWYPQPTHWRTVQLEALRRSGLTTLLMETAPRCAVFVWGEPASVGYAGALARHLGRGDLQITLPQWLEGFRGQRPTPVVIDHACRLTAQQAGQIQWIEGKR